MHTAKSVRWWALQEKCKPLKEKLQFISGFCKVGLQSTARFQKKTFSLWSSEALHLAQDCAGWTQVSLIYNALCLVDCCYHTAVYRTRYVISCIGHKTQQNMLVPHSTLLLLWAVCVVAGRNVAPLPDELSSASSITEIVQSSREMFAGICCMQIAAK